jgi:hypothetical protein
MGNDISGYIGPGIYQPADHLCLKKIPGTRSELAAGVKYGNINGLRYCYFYTRFPFKLTGKRKA